MAVESCFLVFSNENGGAIDVESTIRGLFSDGRSAREWRLELEEEVLRARGLALGSATATVAFPPSVPFPPSLPPRRELLSSSRNHVIE